MSDKNDGSYEELRLRCISKFRKLYKDSLAFDLCKVPQALRIKMLSDPVYLAETKSARASLFESQLDKLDEILEGVYAEEGKDNSSVILKALEMKNKLLLDDLDVTRDESTALNVAFASMGREEFEALETVELNEGTNNASLSLPADFAVSEDTDSFEARMKKDITQKLKDAGVDE